MKRWSTGEKKQMAVPGPSPPWDQTVVGLLLIEAMKTVGHAGGEGALESANVAHGGWLY